LNIVSLHGDGEPHRTWLDIIRTDDKLVYYLPAQQVVQEAAGETWSSGYPVISMFWPDKYYNVFLLLQPHDTAYYCNISTPPKITEGAITYRDLDLDLSVKPGSIDILDEAEFVERSRVYPADWIREAKHAITSLYELAVSKEGPFDPEVAIFWRNWLENNRKTSH